jgi:membrane-associated phospholipid phosphatase
MTDSNASDSWRDRLARWPDRFDSFDKRVDAAWDSVRGRPIVDKVMYTASEMGDFGVVWMAVGGVAAVATGRPEHGRALVRLAGALAVESALVNQGIKRLFRRERPEVQDRPLDLRTPSTTSFPSGHATSAMTALVLLSETAGPATVALAAGGAVVASSRVHVRIHHASDVIGGLVVGAVVGTLIRRTFPLR